MTSPDMLLTVDISLKFSTCFLVGDTL